MKILNRYSGHNILEDYTLDCNDLTIFTHRNVGVSEEVAEVLCEYLKKHNEVVLIEEKMFNGSWKGRYFWLNGINYAPNANDFNEDKLKKYLNR